MSEGILRLHSHSALERELKYPKHIVLVDEEYKPVFFGCGADITTVKYRGRNYIKVPTLLFAQKGGMFKNLMK